MNNLKENKMGTMPVGKLLFQMALPLALSMLVQALYNVVDSIFVAQISDSDNYALTAVSLAFPVQNIMIGIATGISVGVNALMSRALGERNLGDKNTVNHIVKSLYQHRQGQRQCHLEQELANGHGSHFIFF